MDTCKSSGSQTADKQIVTGPCLLVGFQLYGDGTNAATLVVYDGIGTGGEVIVKCYANPAAANGASTYESRSFPFPIECGSGIYADITGTNAEYCIEYID